MKTMFGVTQLVETELWVGPVPDEGIKAFTINDEKLDESESAEVPDLPADEKVAEETLKHTEDMEIGSYWEDLEFTVNINENAEEKATADEDGIPLMNQPIRVAGRVAVRCHPTAKTKDGKPLNVVYFKRIGNAMPHFWQQVIENILNGVAYLMVNTNTKYFKVKDNITKAVAVNVVDDMKEEDENKNSMSTSVVNAAVAVTAAVNPFSCCTTNAAKELAN